MVDEVRGAIELNMRVIGDVGAGEAPTPPGAGGAPTEIKEQRRQSIVFMGNMTKFLTMIGFGFGIMEILKHSKIVSITTNAVFEMLSAIFDLMLVPFMPLIVRALQVLVLAVQGWAYISQGLTMLINDFPGTIMKLGKLLADLFKILWDDLKETLSRLPVVGRFFAEREGLAGTRTEEMIAQGLIATPPEQETTFIQRALRMILPLVVPSAQALAGNPVPIINIFLEGKKVENVRIEQREQYGDNLGKTDWEKRENY